MLDATQNHRATKRHAVVTTVVTPPKTPTEAAWSVSSIGTASLPVPLQQYIVTPMSTLLQTLWKLKHHQNLVSKLTEENKIPASARIKFELRASHLTSQTQDYEVLQTTTAKLVAQFQQQLKEQIVKLQKLEEETVQARFLTELGTMTHAYIKAHMLWHDNV